MNEHVVPTNWRGFFQMKEENIENLWKKSRKSQFFVVVTIMTTINTKVNPCRYKCKSCEKKLISFFWYYKQKPKDNYIKPTEIIEKKNENLTIYKAI